MVEMEKDEWLSWEEISGRDDPKQRFRIYSRHNTEDHPRLLATCEFEDEVGLAIVTLGKEGEFDDRVLGLLDTQGEKGHRWLVVPYLPAV